jgi:NAD(P)-dependent dehydrogenase (short-subunit alcohol dehydrogenase family)
MAQEGCQISICARDSKQLGSAAVAEFTAQGHYARGTQADVTKEEDAARFYQDTVAELGNPDILG